MALLTNPSSLLTRIESLLFRVFLERRLRLSLPLSERICRCGPSIDSYGHHRAACSRTGVLGRRGFALESAVARVGRDTGGLVAANLYVRNMDLGLPRAGNNKRLEVVVDGDNMRLEVVVDGLPLHGGAQLAVETTLVSARKGDGEPKRGAADHDGVALAATRRDKKKHTLRWSDLVHAYDWRFSLWKWAADGPKKPRSLCGYWQVLGPNQNHDSCDVALTKRGDSVGTESFHAPQQCRLLLRCCVCGVGTGPMGKRFRLTRSSGIRQRPSVNERHHSCVVRVWMRRFLAFKCREKM